MQSSDYYILNRETGKVELHFEKESYLALTQEQKSRIKSNFLWGRSSGCWISRCKWPNTSYAEKVAKDIGLVDEGEQGERLSFAEQMEQKAERAERRAERYDSRADSHEARGEALQAPIMGMHGDVAFFTQPNVNTSAGRAFTNRRARMFESFEKGFEHFNRSEYWRDRAKAARGTASQKGLQDRAFLQRRIDERMADISGLRRTIEEFEGYQGSLESGEPLKNKYGWDVNLTMEEVQSHLDGALDRLEAKLDELGFYQDCMDALGGVQFSRDNIKPGYIIKVNRWGTEAWEVVSTGPKNIVVKDASGFPLRFSYAEIEKVLKAVEKQTEIHPFKVGDTFDEAEIATYPNGQTGRAVWKKVHCEVMKATDKSVSISVDGGKPMIRKPYKSRWSNDPVWYIDLGEHFIVPFGKRWGKAC